MGGVIVGILKCELLNASHSSGGFDGLVGFIRAEDGVTARIFDHGQNARVVKKDDGDIHIARGVFRDRFPVDVSLSTAFAGWLASDL